jgi:hypothetical protein
MAIDFSKPSKSEVHGLPVETRADDTYITLWAHKPSVDEGGNVSRQRGVIATDRYPGSDKWGLVNKAFRNGWFTWPPGQEPSREALRLYVGSDNQRDVIPQVEAACKALEEKFGGQEVNQEPTAATEPSPSSVESSPQVHTVEKLVCPFCDEFQDETKGELIQHMDSEHQVKERRSRRQRRKQPSTPELPVTLDESIDSGVHSEVSVEA